MDNVGNGATASTDLALAPTKNITPVREAVLGLLVVQVFFGVLPVVGQVAFASFPPLALAALRVGMATIIMAIMHVTLMPERVAPRHIALMGLFALFGIVGNQILFLLGLARTDPVAASVLVTTIPVFTLLVAVVAGVEQPGPRKVAGIALAFAGVVVLVGVTPAAFSSGNALGNLLVALNSLSYAIYLVMARNLVRIYKPLTVAVWTFFLGSLIIIPIGIPSLLSVDWSHVPRIGWASLGFIVLFPTVGAYVINNWALGKVPPSTVAVYIYLQPPVAALLAYFVFDFVPGWRTLLGAAFIFAGVWAAARSKRSGRLPTFGRTRV